MVKVNLIITLIFLKRQMTALLCLESVLGTGQIWWCSIWFCIGWLCIGHLERCEYFWYLNFSSWRLGQGSSKVSLSLKQARVYAHFIYFKVHCDLYLLKFNGVYTIFWGQAHFTGFCFNFNKRKQLFGRIH